MIYPIAEEFSSLQGEGCYTGTPMRFIRLAACNVGKYDSPHDYATCTTIFGEKFLCDTNYKMKYRKSTEFVLQLDDGSPVREEHICLTGGEPFLHDLGPIYDACMQADKRLHIETSGTKTFKRLFSSGHFIPNLWITCSPKEGFLDENFRFVSEWKFVLGNNSLFDLEQSAARVENFFRGRIGIKNDIPIFIQPVNTIENIDLNNMERVVKLLHLHPNWRLSAQLHKFLRLR